MTNLPSLRNHLEMVPDENKKKLKMRWNGVIPSLFIHLIIIGQVGKPEGIIIKAASAVSYGTGEVIDATHRLVIALFGPSTSNSFQMF